MNPLWLKDPVKWESLQLSEKVKLLRKYYYSGPCGQSSSVLATKSALEKTLKEVESALVEMGL